MSELEVRLTAPAFEIIDRNFKPLSVPLARDSDPIVFRLRPKSTGEKKIKVEFFQSDRYIGGAQVTTKVMSRIGKRQSALTLVSGNGITKQGAK